MKYLYFLQIMLVSHIALVAQPSLRVGSSVGTYRMKNLKEFNEELKSLVPVQEKSVSEYPPYIGYEMSFGLGFAKSHHLDVIYAFSSTGSRIDYEDYSGKLRYDIVLKAKQFGLTYGYKLSSGKFLDVIGSIRVGAINTDMSLKSHLKMAGAPESVTDVDFVSRSYFVSPGIEFRKDISSQLYIMADVRYLLDGQQALTLEKDRDVLMVDRKGMTRSADWSGLRAGLSLGIKMIQKSKEISATMQ